MLQTFRLNALALACTGLLAGCGGGDDGAAVHLETSTSISGVAAKGLLANALVSVHPVKDDGTADIATVLAENTTDSAGKYNLVFNTVAGKIYLVRVRAVAGTTHLDEVTNAPQALPAGFSMRALVQVENSNPLTVHLSPFTEIAAAAAEKAGGFSDGPVRQAQSNIEQLLGFDPRAVEPKMLSVAASASGGAAANEQKLAALLAAVSKLSQSGELGCADPDAGKRTDCVVRQLAAGTSLQSIKPGRVGEIDVSARLSDALVQVLSDPAINMQSATSSGVLQAVLNNLSGPGTPGTATVDSPLVAAKLLFSDLRVVLASLFSAEGANAESALEGEATRFKQALDDVSVPAELLVKDTTALLVGADLFIDFIEGRKGNTESRYRGEVSGNFPNRMPAIGCGVYKDDVGIALAATRTEAKTVFCNAWFRRDSVFDRRTGQNTVTTYRHRFQMTPNADQTAFSYKSRARKNVTVGTNPATLSDLETAPDGSPLNWEGALNVTLGKSPVHGGREVNGFTISGDIPAMFKPGSGVLYNPGERNVLSVRGTRNLTGLSRAEREVTNVEGTVQVYKGGVVDSTLSVRPKSELVVRRVRDGEVPGEAISGALNLLFATSRSEVEGNLTVAEVQSDRSGTDAAPARVTLGGVLRNRGSDGAMAEFASGSIVVERTGYAEYDATKADSATNRFRDTAMVTLAATAPQRPKVDAALTFSRFSNESAVGSANGQFRTFVNGAPRQVLTIDAVNRVGTTPRQVTLTEATSGLTFTAIDGQRRFDLRKGTTVVGTIDLDAKRVSFTDGQFIALN